MVTQEYLIEKGFVKCPRINEMTPTLGEGFICHQYKDLIVEVDYKDIAIYFEADREVHDYNGELQLLILERHDSFNKKRLENLIQALYGD